jgi:hypothetical protein
MRPIENGVKWSSAPLATPASDDRQLVVAPEQHRLKS